MPILAMVQKYGTYREIAPGEHAGPCPQCGGAVRFRIRREQNEGKCGICSFVLTGTAPAPAAGAENGQANFDAAKMQQQVSDTVSRITSACPKGALEWIDRHRPEVAGHLLEAGKKVDAAFEAQDADVLLKALGNYEKFHARAFQIYEKRPPVIERQDELVDATQPATER